MFQNPSSLNILSPSLRQDGLVAWFLAVGTVVMRPLLGLILVFTCRTACAVGGLCGGAGRVSGLTSAQWLVGFAGLMCVGWRWGGGFVCGRG